MSKRALVIPTLNAMAQLGALLGATKQQFCQCDLIVIDSDSTDDTVETVSQYGAKVHLINRCDFDHGATRQLALSLTDADILVYMTQDAILADEHAIENIIKAFDDPKVGCAYGRQLPHKDANLLAKHTRLFNYPEQSYVRSYEDRDQYGIKTCFMSNSFAAYRRSALEQVGGFPSSNILGEDMFVAAKMLQAGWKVAYCADAKVYHSHNYSLGEEFKRYFDIGVFHTEQHWILDAFKSPSKEGASYVKSEFAYCISHKKYSALVRSFFTIACKLMGYRLGRVYKRLPRCIVKRMSMSRHYWK